ncbi:MAG: STAS domain-containing protein [Solirubrobacteraceae bacterium]
MVAVGELDLATAPLLEDQLRDVTDAGFAHIVLDLRGLTLIDCAGLRVLLGAHARAGETATQLTVRCDPGQVARVLALTGVDHHLHTVAPAVAGEASTRPLP